MIVWDECIVSAVADSPWGPVRIAASDRGVLAVAMLATPEAFAATLPSTFIAGSCFHTNAWPWVQLRSWPYVMSIWSPVAAVLPSRAASASTAAGALHHLLGAAHELVELVHGLVVVVDAAEAQKDRIGGPQLGEELAATFTAGWTVAPPGMVVVPNRAIASCIASPQAVARMPSSPSTQQVIASPEK